RERSVALTDGNRPAPALLAELLAAPLSARPACRIPSTSSAGRGAAGTPLTISLTVGNEKRPTSREVGRLVWRGGRDSNPPPPAVQGGRLNRLKNTTDS